MNIHAGGFLVNQSRTQEQLRFNNILPIYLKYCITFSLLYVHLHTFKLVNASSKKVILDSDR